MTAFSGRTTSLPWYSRLLLCLAILVPLTLLGGRQEAVRADTAVLEQIDSNALIKRLSDAFANGSQSTASRLARAGFGDVVAEIQKLDSNRLQSFSSDLMIETLYRRLENESERKRFLAVLYRDAATDSAAITVDPDFDDLRKVPKAELKKPFTFVPMAALSALGNQPPLPSNIENAIGKIAEIYAGPNLGRARAVLMHTLRLDHRAFEGAIASSQSTGEAVRKMVALYRPPPSVETALSATLHGAQASSAALSIDGDMAKVIDDLSKDLPPELKNYEQVKDQLKSRVHQTKQAEQLGTPAAVAADQSKRAYSNYLETTFEPTSGSGGGGGGGAPKIKATPRTYKTAIRSARAARGVAAGGNVTLELEASPIRAIWMPNATDPSFGRLIVQFSGNSKPTVAASRVVFADSFFSAASVLYGEHDSQAAFVDGQILVLMSMDPAATGRLLEQEFDKLPRDQQQLFMRLRQAKAELGRTIVKMSATPAARRGVEAFLRKEKGYRAVVIHPALQRRELAWSAVRMDFSFNNLLLLSQESQQTNGGVALPEELSRISFGDASTWQFFERDSIIAVEDMDGEAKKLLVHSKDDSGESDRSHFAISMFSVTDKKGEGCEDFGEGQYSCSLQDVASAVQPLLDWLAVNHHDFMRMNDFSESFTLLRWLQKENVKLTVVDIEGMLNPVEVGSAIATPNAIMIGEGPIVTDGPPATP